MKGIRQYLVSYRDSAGDAACNRSSFAGFSPLALIAMEAKIAVSAARTTVRIEIRNRRRRCHVDRPRVRNTVDRATAERWRYFVVDANDSLRVRDSLTGARGNFCAGADLKALAAGDGNHMSDDGDGPMGPTRMLLSKPVIAAVEGYAVAGGLELALWCDLRVAASNAIFGVFCRRFGVPLVDLGTVRLPRLIGQSRAMDLILTGRPVSGDEALSIGLANRVCESGKALDTAIALAESLSALPQRCMRSDRLSAYEQWSRDWDAAMRNEFRRGREVVASGETVAGAARFSSGAGRHGGGVSADNESRPKERSTADISHTLVIEGVRGQPRSATSWDTESKYDRRDIFDRNCFIPRAELRAGGAMAALESSP